jgi:phosphohistidine phosphatase
MWQRTYMTIQLVIMRHAKAERTAATDHARQLTDRGRRDAVAAGQMLAQSGASLELALVSTAARAQETWSGVMRGMRIDLSPTLDQGLYMGAAEDVMELLTTIDESVASVIVVGHNPAMEMLSHALDDGSGPAEVRTERDTSYPTSAWSTFRGQESWSDVREGALTLTDFGVGRG